MAERTALVQACLARVRENVFSGSAWLALARNRHTPEGRKALSDAYMALIGAESTPNAELLRRSHLDKDPENRDVRCALVNSLFQRGAFAPAHLVLQGLETVLVKDNRVVWFELLQDLGELEKAEEVLKELSANFSTDSQLFCRALAHKATLDGDYSLARDYFEKAQLPGESAKCELGFAELRVGNFKRGWDLYEHRFALMPTFSKTPGVNSWTGKETGQTILVRCEQGLGDSIQFFRFLPRLKKYFQTIILEVPMPLFRLAESLDSVDLLIPQDSLLLNSLSFDYTLPIMSLGKTLEIDVDSLGTDLIPYLQPPETLCPIPPPTSSRRVGLVWCGSSVHKRDCFRSVCLNAFADLASVEGVQFVSLQNGQAGYQAQYPPPGMDILDQSPFLLDMGDVAALIEGLDLIICVDTAVAHLAGALGKPVWVMIPARPDWRWMAGESSPWYPSMRLFRQERHGDWSVVLRQIRDALEEWTGNLN